MLLNSPFLSQFLVLVAFLAKLNGVDPQAWLTDTLGRIADHKVMRIEELMPWRYAQV